MSLNTPIKDWHGKTVWLLGASSGIGRATASALHAKGARVVVSAPLPPWISRSLALGNGGVAARVAPDIAFPASQGADPFEGYLADPKQGPTSYTVRLTCTPHGGEPVPRVLTLTIVLQLFFY